MGYHHHFDSLGRRVYTRPQASALHRAARYLSAAVIVVCVAILVWGR